MRAEEKLIEVLQRKWENREWRKMIARARKKGALVLETTFSKKNTQNAINQNNSTERCTG